MISMFKPVCPVQTKMDIAYLFGIRSKHQLVREIDVNVAYRCFLGLRLVAPVPEVSTLWQNRW